GAELPGEVEPVVRLFDGGRRVRAVVLESSLPETLVLQVSSRLYASGALLPARVARERGLEPLPVRIHDGWDDPVPPRTLTPPPSGISGPFVPWATGSTPAPTPAPPPPTAPAPAPAGGPPPELRAPAAAAEPPANATPVLEGPGLAWDAPSASGEMERALRAMPLGLEPPEPPRARIQTPPNPVPQARAAPA